MKYLLGIDFGGGASKATLLSEEGVICATNTTEYATNCGKFLCRQGLLTLTVAQVQKTEVEETDVS